MSSAASSIDFSAVHARRPLANYCRQLGIELRRTGLNYVGLCPLHQENTPSFTVYPDNHFHCFGCGAHGDIIDLERALRGGTVRQAVERLGTAITVGINPSNSQRRPTVKIPAYKLTDDDQGLIADAALALLRDPKLVLRVRDHLPMSAIERIAFEGNIGFCRGLAFAGICGPALLFRYKNGIKARWPGKVVRWICGSPFDTCWRQDQLLDSHRRIYLTEGETDALSLLSIEGVERFCDSLVVSLPNASGTLEPSPFAGREVILIPDTDKAGQGCAQRLSESLVRVSRAIKIINVGRFVSR